MFVNAAADKAELERALSGIRDFVGYLKGGKPESDLTRRIDAAVAAQKSDESGRRLYMTLLERDQRNRDEGLHQGRIEGARNVLFGLVSDGTISIDIGAEKLGIGTKDFEAMMSAAGYSVRPGA